MCHSLLIHSPTKGYLGCFQVLAILSRDCYKYPGTSFWVAVKFLIHLGKYRTAWLLAGSYDNVFTYIRNWASQVALVVKNKLDNAEDIRDLGRSSGGGHGNLLQYSCLENPMNRGAWRATVHGIARVGHDLVTKPPPWNSSARLDFGNRTSVKSGISPILIQTFYWYP